MLLTPLAKLEDLVVEALGRGSAMTGSVLHQHICRTSRSCTVQAVYQELRKLQRAGVVIKHRDRFSLRLGWVLAMRKMVDDMYAGALRALSPEELIPADGSKRTWRFHDLQTVVSFYTELSLTLLAASDGRCYEYAPHVWYHFAHAQAEKQFLEALSLSGGRYYLVVANRTYLDLQYKRYLVGVPGEAHFGRAMLEGERVRSYLMVCGEFVVTLTLDSTLESSLDDLYRRVKTAEDVNVGELSDVMHRSSKITLHLRRSARAAATLRNRFVRFLGLPKV